eukprot:7171306-Pyramimonas_sp.AAC.1
MCGELLCRAQSIVKVHKRAPRPGLQAHAQPRARAVGGQSSASPGAQEAGGVDGDARQAAGTCPRGQGEGAYVVEDRAATACCPWRRCKRSHGGHIE